MPDARLPIKVKRIPGGYTVDLADGRKLWIYGREPEVARAAKAMTLDEARATDEGWGAGG
jgi:lipocalin